MSVVHPKGEAVLSCVLLFGGDVLHRACSLACTNCDFVSLYGGAGRRRHQANRLDSSQKSLR